jgi:hypothetical protein
MPSTFLEDYIYGKEQEKLCFRTIKRYFGGNLKHNDDEFAPFDFEGSNMKIEMKSRKILSTEFDTAMIKSLKVDRCIDETADCFLVFKYLDIFYAIAYDRVKFAKYKRKLMKIEDRPDKKETWEWRTFIPMTDMEVIKRYPIECLID